MPWRYEQSTGRLYKPDGSLFHTGYSGLHWAKNQPVLQHIKYMGPIPQGLWKMDQWFPTYPGRGPNVISLKPEPGTTDFTRDGFLIHGDNMEQEASQGCIIVNNPTKRLQIWNHGDRFIRVVP